MSGPVSFTIRTTDKTEHRMCRSTRCLPWAITNQFMIEKSPVHIEQATFNWYDMLADYELNKSTGKYKYNMTNVYLPGVGLAPYSYGLVVVDMVNDVILTAQNYTSVGKFYKDFSSSVYYSLSDDNLSDEDIIEILKNAVDSSGPSMEEDDMVAFARLWFNGKVKHESYWNSKGIELVDASTLSLVDIVNRRDFKRYNTFTIDMSPFVIEKFENTVEDYTKMLKRVDELGFVLSDDEEKTWSEWLEELSKDEECEEEE